jgi:hypothetical protein
MNQRTINLIIAGFEFTKRVICVDFIPSPMYSPKPSMKKSRLVSFPMSFRATSLAISIDSLFSLLFASPEAARAFPIRVTVSSFGV